MKKVIKKFFAYITLVSIVASFMFIPVKADNLPVGFEPVDDVFVIANSDGNQPYEYDKIDGIYMELAYATSLPRICSSTNVYGMSIEEYNPDGTYTYDTYSQTINSGESITVTRKDGGNDVKVIGTSSYKHTFPGGEGAAYEAGEFCAENTEFSISLTNIIFGNEEFPYHVMADVDGYINYVGGYNNYDTNERLDFNEDKVLCNYGVDGTKGKAYVTFVAGDNVCMWFEIKGLIPKKSNTVNIGNALSFGGEDSGVSVPATIAIGVTAGGAGVAGALIGGANSILQGNPEDEKKKRLTGELKMYIQKDFGNSVRRGGKPVIVRARMAEDCGDGVIKDRPDLTPRISVKSNDFQVHGARISGRYLEATVSIPDNKKMDEAVLSFVFSGVGGDFTNSVIFRVSDGAKIKFLENVSHRGENTCELDCIYGDGFTYYGFFMIEDTPNPPKLSDISGVPNPEFDFKFELTDRPGVFRVAVKNNSRLPVDKKSFPKTEETELQFTVKAEDEKEPLTGYIDMKKYPEGLSAKSRYEESKNGVDYIRVQCFAKDYYGGLDNKWQVTEVEYTLAVKGEDKAIIDPDGAEYNFDKIKGSGGLGTKAYKEDSVAKKMQYKGEKSIFNDKTVYTFEPNSTLCEPEDGSFYMVLLPTSCDYKGTRYTLDVPLRLRGLDPDPYEDWDIEYEKLKNRIEIFSIPGERGFWLGKLELVAIDPKASTAELRLASKYLVRQYMRYWTVERIANLNDAELYDNIVGQLEWLKFAGDCAFSYLMTAYAGPVAEALISPAKDFAVENIGELIALWNHGEEITLKKFSVAKYLEAAGDNIVSNGIKFTDWRTAARTLAAYFVYSSIKNYIKKWREDGESDVWGAFVDGFSDMTVQGLKAAAGELFENWVKNSESFKTGFWAKASKWFNDNLGRGRTINLKTQKIQNVQYQINEVLKTDPISNLKLDGASKKVAITKSSIVQKYLQELIGKEGGETVEELDKKVDTTGGFTIGKDGHVLFQTTIDFKCFADEPGPTKFLITFDLTKVLMAAACPFFAMIWELFCGNLIPFAPKVCEIPKDPPLPPAKD